MSKYTDFINTIGTIARNEYLARDKWVLPSVCIAQAAIESGWNLDAPTLFGIKGTGFVATTSEYLNGHWVEIQDSFRKYPGVAESVVGYYDFLRDTPRYANVLNNNDYKSAIYHLQHTTDGLSYATAPNYEEVLLSIISQYNLTEWDKRDVAPQPKYSLDEIAQAVIRGDWGNGVDRINALNAAGYNYNEVQARVDEILGATPQNPGICVGCRIRILPGATDLNSGCGFADFVYNGTYEVIEISGNRVVFGLDGVVTGATDISNCTW